MENYTVTPHNVDNANENLNKALSLIQTLVRTNKGRFGEKEAQVNAEDASIFNHANQPVDDDSADPISFRGKEMGHQLSYCILSFFELKKGQPVGVRQVSSAVSTVFGGTNRASINTKMNRWRDDGVLQWSNSDRRMITTKGIHLKSHYADLIAPETKSIIDSALNSL